MKSRHVSGPTGSLELENMMKSEVEGPVKIWRLEDSCQEMEPKSL